MFNHTHAPSPRFSDHDRQPQGQPRHHDAHQRARVDSRHHQPASVSSYGRDSDHAPHYRSRSHEYASQLPGSRHAPPSSSSHASSHSPRHGQHQAVLMHPPPTSSSSRVAYHDDQRRQELHRVPPHRPQHPQHPHHVRSSVLHQQSSHTAPQRPKPSAPSRPGYYRARESSHVAPSAPRTRQQPPAQLALQRPSSVSSAASCLPSISKATDLGALVSEFMGKLDRVSMALRPSVQSLQNFISCHIERMIALWSPYNNPEAAGEHISVFRLMKKLEAKARVFVDPRWLKPLVDQMHESMVYIRDKNDQSEFAMLIETLREKAQKATDWKPTYATIVQGDAATWEQKVRRGVPPAAVCKQKIADFFSTKMIVKERLSLVDSFSQGRISIPVRGGNCSHIQVFDLRTYLNRWFRSQDKEGAWHCEHCEKLALPSSLVVDSFILQILGEIGPTERDVFLTEDGWMTTAKSKKAKKRPKGAYSSSASSSQASQSRPFNAVDLDANDDEPGRAAAGDSSLSAQSYSVAPPSASSSVASSSSNGLSTRQSTVGTNSPRAHVSPSASIDLTSPAAPKRPAAPQPSNQRMRNAHQKSLSARAPPHATSSSIFSASREKSTVRSTLPHAAANSGALSKSSRSRSDAASSRVRERRPAPAASSSDAMSRIEKRMNGISLSGQVNRASQAPKRKRANEELPNGVLANGSRQHHSVSNSQQPKKISSNPSANGSAGPKRRRLQRLSDAPPKKAQHVKKRPAIDPRNGLTPNRVSAKPKQRIQKLDSFRSARDASELRKSHVIQKKQKRSKKAGLPPPVARPQKAQANRMQEKNSIKKKKKPKKRLRRFADDSETEDASDLDYDDNAGSRSPSREIRRKRRREVETSDEEYALELSNIRRNPSRRGRAAPERLTCTEDGMQTTKIPEEDGYDSDAPIFPSVKKKKKKPPVVPVGAIDFDDPRRAPVMVSETGEPFYEVENLVKRRRNAAGTGYDFLVKWDGYAHSENTWEPEGNLRDNCAHLMDTWDDRPK